MDAVLFETTDALGINVALYREQWETHICTGHPEVASYSNQIKECLESPECIYSSAVRDDVKTFYRRFMSAGRFGPLYLKVIVAYDRSPASVVTTYFCPHITGGDLLWLKTRL